MVFETTCDLDVTYFPFDTQTWSVIVKSFGLHVLWCQFYQRLLQNRIVPICAQQYWDLISYEATTNYYHRDTVLSFNLKLKRKPEYFVLNPILPKVFVCILNLIVFIIPPDSGEKFIDHNFSLLCSFPVNFQAELPMNFGSTSILSIYLMIE